MESIDILKKGRTYAKTTSQDFSSIMYGKLPPQARELEEAVIGALLIDKEALNEVIDILKSEVFYVEAHKIIFNAINQLFDKSEPIDLLTVAQQLRKNGELDLIGGAYYLSELTNKVASAANIEYHSRIVIQKHIQRKLIEISNTIIKDAYEDTTDVLELLDKAEKNIFSVAEQNLKRGSNNMKGLLSETLEEINEIRNKESGLVGVPSGFTHLDAVTGGWQKSDLVIIAARPAMGKTAFVLNIARTAAVDYNIPVAVFSLEMSATQLVKRLMSTETEIEAHKIHQGKLSDQEWDVLSRRSEKLANAPIYINDTPGLNIFEFRAQCRRLKSAHDIQMVIIDYLQLMSGNSDGKGSTREQEISSISRALKGIAKELNIPVLALSQLSRAVESRTGEKRPQLSDLRESGAIEQDADMVLGLYRPEYYGFTEDANKESTQGLTEIIIMKNRHGSVETIKLEFVKEYTKFKEWNQYGYQLANANYETSNYASNSFGGGSDSLSSFQTMPSKMNERMDDGDDTEEYHDHDGRDTPF
ncbi:MAG: replicative DNA helicase [Chitinophagales bacterium]|nr:replicative DNA helicase [Chitinophagales bacterium]